MIVFIRPWQHIVCSPVEAPASVYSSSFHSQFPAENLCQNLKSIKYITHKLNDIKPYSKKATCPVSETCTIPLSGLEDIPCAANAGDILYPHSVV